MCLASMKSPSFWPFCSLESLKLQGFNSGVGIIPLQRDGEWEQWSGHIIRLLSLNTCTKLGIAKRPILFVLFF